MSGGVGVTFNTHRRCRYGATRRPQQVQTAGVRVELYKTVSQTTGEPVYMRQVCSRTGRTDALRRKISTYVNEPPVIGEVVEAGKKAGVVGNGDNSIVVNRERHEVMRSMSRRCP